LKLNIDIPLNVCGYGLRIRHLSGGGGILLNARKIGNYCSFNSGVLLGNKDDNSKKPILGERVSFGPSAKAFGDIVIEDDVFVARYVNCIDSFYMTGDVLCRYYVNSYKRFWDKYRFDIFDTSRQSTMYVKDIVLSWNRNNKDVLQRIYDDYFHKTFGSFCFLFNPNLKLNRKARYARLKEITDIFMDDISCDGIEINHPIFKCMKKKNYRAIYVRIVLHIWKHKFD